MTITGIIGIVGAALVGLVGLLFKLWRGAAAREKTAIKATEAERGARLDDVGRLEDVVKIQKETKQNVPKDIEGVRSAVRDLGGVPLPDDSDPKSGV